LYQKVIELTCRTPILKYVLDMCAQSNVKFIFWNGPAISANVV